MVLAVSQGDGGKVWISMNSQPLVRFGESAPYAAMASFSDITARKAAEASLRAIMSELEVRVEKRTSQLMEANALLKNEVGERERAQREMHEAKDAADNANRAKSAFLANMSHELRTPLNAVIGFSELLEQEIFGGLNDKQRTYVSNVLVSGRHLLQLVNDILDISKVEAGRMDLTYERTPIGSVVDVVRGVIGALAAKRGINLEVDVPPNLPDVYIDPGRIKQVLYNLISNAIKFTPRGGVVRLTARADARSLVRVGGGHRDRHRPGRSPASVPRVRAARTAQWRASRGDRAGAGADPPAGRAARRPRRGRERAGARLDVLDPAAAALARRLDRDPDGRDAGADRRFGLGQGASYAPMSGAPV